MEENTTGLASAYPERGASAGRDASVTVSPERTSLTDFMPAMRYPTEPASSAAHDSRFMRMWPISSTR